MRVRELDAHSKITQVDKSDNFVATKTESTATASASASANCYGYGYKYKYKYRGSESEAQVAANVFGVWCLVFGPGSGSGLADPALGLDD